MAERYDGTWGTPDLAGDLDGGSTSAEMQDVSLSARFDGPAEIDSAWATPDLVAFLAASEPVAVVEPTDMAWNDDSEIAWNDGSVIGWNG